MAKYERTVWQNDKTPLNADNLNKIEEGIVANEQSIEETNSNLKLKTRRKFRRVCFLLS